jgi:hypothetical protein
LVLGVEEHRTGERGLEEAVAELSVKPGREQAREARLRENRAQVLTTPAGGPIGARRS